MRHLASLTAAMLATACSCMAADAAPPFSAFFGTWKVAQLAGAASVTESQHSANAAIGTEIRISANLIKTYSEHDACNPHDPTVTEVDTEQILQSQFGARISDLNLPKGMMPSRTSFIDAGCAFALAIDADTLLWPMGNGYIYTARREHS
jgi:hypothetical protein